MPTPPNPANAGRESMKTTESMSAGRLVHKKGWKPIAQVRKELLQIQLTAVALRNEVSELKQRLETAERDNLEMRRRIGFLANTTARDAERFPFKL